MRHCTVFWLKWPAYDLVPVIPPPVLIKVASNTRPWSKHGETAVYGGRREVSIISPRPVTSSDLKQESGVSQYFNWSSESFIPLLISTPKQSIEFRGIFIVPITVSDT